MSAAQRVKGNWFATPARAEEAGGCTARWVVECRAVECRPTVRRISGTRYSTVLLSFACQSAVDAGRCRNSPVAGLHSAHAWSDLLALGK